MTWQLELLWSNHSLFAYGCWLYPPPNMILSWLSRAKMQCWNSCTQSSVVTRFLSQFTTSECQLKTEQIHTHSCQLTHLNSNEKSYSWLLYILFFYKMWCAFIKIMIHIFTKTKQLCFISNIINTLKHEYQWLDWWNRQRCKCSIQLGLYFFHLCVSFSWNFFHKKQI